MKTQLFNSPIGESYVKAVHPSGLTVYVMEKPQYSSSFAIFGTKYGSIDTAFSKNGGERIEVPEGIAHFLEHKLFESEDGDAFSRFAKTGANANAFTSFDRTCYLFSCSDKFYENLAILLDFVQSPYFTPQTVQKEQGIIGQEIRMYDDSPSWRVMFNMLLNMYENHPVRIDIAGTVESIARIDYDLLYKCYETFYNPNNMFICVVGNVDAEKVLNQINEGIKSGDKVTVERGEFLESDAVVSNYVEQRFAVAMPMFSFGFKQSIKTPEQSVKDKICMSILLELICGECSPLYASLVNDGLINDEFSCEYFTGRGYASMMFSGESSDPKAVAERIKAEIERLKKEGIDEDLFEAIKCGMYGDSIRRFNSVEGLAMQLAECAVCDYELFDELDTLMDVTPQSVYEMLDCFDNEASVLSVVLPKSE